MNLEQCRDILGTMSDAHVAKHAGCSPRAARRYRIALGIPPVRREYASVLDAYEDAYGIIPDYVIAYMTGETVAAVARHRYDLVILEPKEWPGEQTAYERVDEWIDIVGALSDETVAEFVGVSAAEVAAYREARGFLLECDEEAMRAGVPAPPKKGCSRVTPYVDRLGVDTDVVIARLAGVNPSSVRRMRERLGIGASIEGQSRTGRKIADSRLCKIESFVCASGREVSSAEVSRAFGLQANATSGYMRTLLDAGRVDRPSRGFYAAPVP